MVMTWSTRGPYPRRFVEECFFDAKVNKGDASGVNATNILGRCDFEKCDECAPRRRPGFRWLPPTLGSLPHSETGTGRLIFNGDGSFVPNTARSAPGPPGTGTTYRDHFTRATTVRPLIPLRRSRPGPCAHRLRACAGLDLRRGGAGRVLQCRRQQADHPSRVRHNGGSGAGVVVVMALAKGVVVACLSNSDE